MELEPEAPARHEGLHPEIGLGDDVGTGRRRDHVEVPLEPRALRDQVRGTGPYGHPSDLGFLPPVHLSAQDPGQQLSAEAQPQDWDVGALFKLLQNYGDSTTASTLEQLEGPFKYYATMSLAGMQGGEGVAPADAMLDLALEENLETKFRWENRTPAWEAR